jgi:hypothetical protein
MRKLLLVMSLLIAAIGVAAPSAAADTESTGADQFPSGTNVTPAMIAGTGGCRWKGSLTFDLIGSDWLTSLAWAVPGSQSSAFWDDSGRIYGSAYLFWSFQVLQVCEDDYIWDHLGQPAGNGVVHFMGITGIDYGTFNMANKCTGTFRADDTS